MDRARFRHAPRQESRFDPFPMVIDLILPRELEVTEARRCPPERCESLSDHLPVIARLRAVLRD